MINDPIQVLFDWSEAGIRGALATVVETYGSSPRPLGSLMAISESGQMVGSVSAGCVEGAVVEEAINVLTDGRSRLQTYGISNEWAAGVGLSCGGNISIFIQPWRLSSIWRELQVSRKDKQAVALVTVLAGRHPGENSVFWPDGRGAGPLRPYYDGLKPLLDAAFAQQRPQRAKILTERQSDVFVLPFFPPQRLIIIGAVHIALSLVTFANELGYETIVVDPRPTFASHDRFPHADQLLTLWPQEALPRLKLDAGTSVAVISHDDKLDLPALELALNSEARYVGALGSRRTMARRVTALQDSGLTDEDIARIHNPIGLDLGGRSPEEIALSIMAEIVATRYGR